MCDSEARMSDSGPVSECVNCALVVDRLEEMKELELGPLAVFIIPGAFFLALGLRYCLGKQLRSCEHRNFLRGARSPQMFWIKQQQMSEWLGWYFSLRLHSDNTAHGC